MIVNPDAPPSTVLREAAHKSALAGDDGWRIGRVHADSSLQVAPFAPGSDSGACLDNSRKSLRVVHGQMCQNLSVELDIRLAQRPHELGIGGAVEASTGIDTCNPQTAELTFAGTTVPVLILKGLVDGVLGNGVYVATTAPIAFGHSHDHLAALAGGYSVCCAWHFILRIECSLKTRGRPEGGEGGEISAVDQLPHTRFINAIDQGRTTQVTLALRRLLGQDVALERFFATDSASAGRRKTLFGATIGLHLGHNNCLFGA